jgi:hypothetical protein
MRNPGRQEKRKTQGQARASTTPPVMLFSWLPGFLIQASLFCLVFSVCSVASV